MANKKGGHAAHGAREHIGLITPKQFKEEPGAFVTEHITGHKTVSAYDINYLFPLYLYSDKSKGKLSDIKATKLERTQNFTPEFLHAEGSFVNGLRKVQEPERAWQGTGGTAFA